MLFGHQDGGGGGGGLGPTDKSIFCKSSIYFRAGPCIAYNMQQMTQADNIFRCNSCSYS